jgi:hypothetical protein
MRVRRLLIVGLVVAVAFGFIASPAEASRKYTRLTKRHTVQGVSQFLCHRPGGDGDYVKLVNPTSVTMIVAILSYDSNSGGSGSGTREFLDYRVVRLEPHEAASWDGEDGDFGGSYLEIIAAPETKVRVGGRYTRRANGLGISGTMGSYGGGHLWLLHPSLFTLPEDAPFPGQRQDAIDAIIDGLDKIGAPRDCFKSFGIDPSDATPAS